MTLQKSIAIMSLNKDYKKIKISLLQHIMFGKNCKKYMMEEKLKGIS